MHKLFPNSTTKLVVYFQDGFWETRIVDLNVRIAYSVLKRTEEAEDLSGVIEEITRSIQVDLVRLDTLGEYLEKNNVSWK